LTSAIEAILAKNGVGQWIDRLIEAGVPCSPINTIDMTLNDPQVRARNMVAWLEDPVAGRLLIAGNSIKMSGLLDPLERPASPRLDMNRAAILKELGVK
jgi:CoA:oxalate CoA-transferase